MRIPYGDPIRGQLKAKRRRANRERRVRLKQDRLMHSLLASQWAEYCTFERLPNGDILAVGRAPEPSFPRRLWNKMMP